MTTTNPACSAVRDDLARLIDGDAAALTAHADHLAGCDACRDARHDGELVARRVVDAGADHVAPSDLAERLLAALDAQAVAAAVVAPPRPASVPAPARRWGKVAAAVLSVGAAAAGAAVMMRPSAPAGHRVVATTAAAAPAAQVVRLARSGALVAGHTGLEVRTTASAAWTPLAADAAIPAGGQVRTDERTRAWLRLPSGDAVALDQGTTLALPAAAHLDLQGGRVVVDGVDGSSLQLVSAHGTLRTLRGRMMATAAGEQTLARAVRGSFSIDGVAATAVHAGEEALLRADAAPRVVPVPSASAELAWSELDVHATPPADSPRGLGSLRAYRPGEQRDRDWNLALAAHDVQVRIAGPLARTEVTETFRNDTDHELEGVFVFPLPADAKIDDLALDAAAAPGGFEHGAFVAKERARKIWNGVIAKAAPQIVRKPAEIVWVPGPWRDPALLDWQRGGRVELRVFPIPAHGQRTIKLAYSQVVAPRGVARQYAYPLAHAADASTAAEKFSIGVEVRGAKAGAVRAGGYALTAAPSADAGVQALAFAQDAFVPRGDLVVQYQAEDDAELRAWTFAGNAAVAPDEALAAKRKVGNDPQVLAAQRTLAADARPTAVLALRPTLPRVAEHRPRDYAIVVDASQTMVGERWARAQQLAATMAGQLDGRDRVTLLACDDDCVDAGALAGASAARSRELASWLASQTPGGASDPIGALRLAAAALPASADRERWILYVGDGVATTGLRKVADLGDAATELTRGTTLRISTVGIGPDADRDALAAIARGGGGSEVAWASGSGVAEVARSAVDSTTSVGLRDVQVVLPPGLVDAAPTTLGTIRAGEEVLLAARVTAPGGAVTGDLVLRGTVGGVPFEQRYPLALTVATGAGNRFVPPLWASLAIDELDRAGTPAATVQAVAMSQAYGVLSRHTSLLVLESQAMFDAFGIDRGRAVPTWDGEGEIEETLVDGAAPAPTPAPAMATGSTSQPVDKAPVPTRAQLEKAEDGAAWSGDELRKPAPVTTRWTTTAGGGAGKAGMVMEAPPRDGRGRPMIAMRKVWDRVPAIGAPRVIDPAVVATARAALAAAPDSRERHRDLVQALAFAGDVDDAIAVAQRWLERDALDPQALDYIADLRGRRGERDLALRTLAGTVDLAPDDAERHARLAAAYAEAGRLRQACGHQLALAGLTPTDASRAAAAVRCSRALAQPGDAERVLRAMPDAAARIAAERLATVAAPLPGATGDLVVRGTWSSGADLDLSVITGSGRRLSWQGGRADLAIDGALSTSGETLAVKKLRRGSYRIEVARPTGAPRGVLRGTVEVVALGQRRTLPFELIGDRAVIGDVRVTLVSRLVRW